MTLIGLRLILLMFALVFFAFAGVALAVARQRASSLGERDIAMLTVTGLLCAFGALCTAVASGAMGVLAFGGVAVWASYVLTAQQMGLFRIETGTRATEAEPSEARRPD